MPVTNNHEKRFAIVRRDDQQFTQADITELAQGFDYVAIGRGHCGAVSGYPNTLYPYPNSDGLSYLVDAAKTIRDTARANGNTDIKILFHINMVYWFFNGVFGKWRVLANSGDAYAVKTHGGTTADILTKKSKLYPYNPVAKVFDMTNSSARDVLLTTINTILSWTYAPEGVFIKVFDGVWLDTSRLLDLDYKNSGTSARDYSQILGKLAAARNGSTEESRVDLPDSEDMTYFNNWNSGVTALVDGIQAANSSAIIVCNAMARTTWSFPQGGVYNGINHDLKSANIMTGAPNANGVLNERFAGFIKGKSEAGKYPKNTRIKWEEIKAYMDVIVSQSSSKKFFLHANYPPIGATMTWKDAGGTIYTDTFTQAFNNRTKRFAFGCFLMVWVSGKVWFKQSGCVSETPEPDSYGGDGDDVSADDYAAGELMLAEADISSERGYSAPSELDGNSGRCDTPETTVLQLGNPTANYSAVSGKTEMYWRPFNYGRVIINAHTAAQNYDFTVTTGETWYNKQGGVNYATYNSGQSYSVSIPSGDALFIEKLH